MDCVTLASLVCAVVIPQDKKTENLTHPVRAINQPCLKTREWLKSDFHGGARFTSCMESYPTLPSKLTPNNF